ncbi:Protein of unknown function [Pseudomonas grimontii]|jgi:hypothetical protein|uniref:DUF1120 domain-containing protein n=1 Tax=Pseudomonas grimontii TaxID=129847 RepID=A0A1H1IX99_9PSED|nr:DUF1120 domain-containing protein [Pseudomonas grimontii]TWR70088.1 DUF1120 domain-containing protein [Pseudomonas grimontii]SDR42345.1 Protein of unknown function [Pseudomonas grimontii]
MSKSLTLLSTALLLNMFSPVQAASSIDLAVKGLITPSACAPTLSGAGVVDHGKISAKDLKPDNPTSLPKHFLRMNVSCEAPTLFGLRGIDNRASSGLTSNYGLGFVNGDKKLGWFYLYLNNPMMDGLPARSIVSYDNGSTWQPEDNLEPLALFAMSDLSDTNTPIAARELAVELEVASGIFATNGMDLSQEVPIDGSATIEVKYL